jgi:tight adherence protein C
MVMELLTQPAALVALLASGGFMGAAGFAVTYGWVNHVDTKQSQALLPQVRLHRLVKLGKTSSSHVRQPANTQKLRDTYLAYRQSVKPLAQTLYGTEHDKLEALLNQAGMTQHNEHAIEELLAERLMLSLLMGGGVFVCVIALPFMLGFKLMIILAALYAGGAIPLWQLKLKAKQRAASIQRDLPDVMDLMVICVEAGLGLDATLKRVAKETKGMAPECAAELAVMSAELMAGLPRVEAFSRFAQRSQVEEVKSFASLMSQSDRMGLSIAQTLRAFSDDLRTRRRQRAEESAAKASVKMTLPLVFFVFPPLMIILLGPMALQILEVFGMGGLVGVGLGGG